MSGTAWLAARLAGYLGGWQTLLDSVCVCGIILCPRQASVHDQWCVSSLPLSPCPEKEQPRRQPAPPVQKEFPEQRGVLTPTPSPQWSPLSQPCTQPFSLSSSGGSQQSMEDTVHDCSCCRHFKKKSLFSSWVSILEPLVPTDHQLTCFLSSSLFFFHPGFDHVTTRLVEFLRSAFFQSCVPIAFASIGC